MYSPASSTRNRSQSPTPLVSSESGSRAATPPLPIHALRNTGSFASTATDSDFPLGESSTSHNNSPHSSFTSESDHDIFKLRARPASPTPLSRKSPSPQTLRPHARKAENADRSCLGRVAFLLWFLSAACALSYFGYHSLQPPRPPLEAIARVTAQHVTLGLDVVKDLTSQRQACSWGELDAVHLDQLAETVRPLSHKTAESLGVTSRAIRELSFSLDKPNVIVSVHFSFLASRLSRIVKILSTLSNTPHRSLKLETDLKFHINDYLASTLPQDLAELRTILDVSLDRSEIVLHQKSIILPELKRLQSELGLTRPWLWWRRRSWDKDAGVKEKMRLVRGTIGSFESVERLMRAVEKSRGSLGRYMRADVFEVVEAYSYADLRTSKISVDHYLDNIAGPLEELQALIQSAQAKSRK